MKRSEFETLIERAVSVQKLGELLEFEDDLKRCLPESKEDIESFFRSLEKIMTTQQEICKKSFEEFPEDR